MEDEREFDGEGGSEFQAGGPQAKCTWKPSFPLTSLAPKNFVTITVVAVTWQKITIRECQLRTEVVLVPTQGCVLFGPTGDNVVRKQVLLLPVSS